MYTPDNWVIIKLKGDDPHYRVLAVAGQVVIQLATLGV